MRDKGKYILYLAIGRKITEAPGYQVLFKMVGAVPRARLDGKFRSPDQLVDHLKIAEATGGLVELSIEVNDLEQVFIEGEDPV